MFKITKLKTWLTACCLLLVVISKAQTGNPLLSFPQNYWQVSGPYSALPNGGASNQYPHIITPNGLAIASYTNYASNEGDTVGPHNMYADASGNPLFSIVNGFMYNAHGYLIDTLADTLTSIGSLSYGSFGSYWYSDSAYRVKKCRQMAEGWAEVCVVPAPGSCKQYYVFTSADATNNYFGYKSCGYSGGTMGKGGYRPYYALIDMSGQTPYGAPAGEMGLNITNTLSKPGGNPSHIADLYMSTSTPSNDGGRCSPHTGGIQYACTKLISGSYRFLFVTNDEEIIVYKITSSGITCVHNYDLTSLPTYGTTYFGTLVPGNNVAELECYVDSTNNIIKVAIEGQNDNINNQSGVALAFATFNMTGASAGLMVSGSYTNVCCSGTSGTSRISGLEFSPNGSYVYVNGNIGLGYYPWTSPSYNAITPAGVTIADFQYSQMELGKDGNLYLIGQHGTSTPRLAKITSPNSASSASTNFTDNVLTLTSYSPTIKTTYSPYSGAGSSTNTIFYIPDQIDQEVYGSQFTGGTGENCCLFYTPYDRQIYHAGAQSGWTGSTQTWSVNTTAGSYQYNPLTLTTSNVVTIGEELRIPAGYTVTIENMTLKFSPQARLIIEGGTSTGTHGGRLILSGCTLTVDNRCITDMWPGVQVWGSPRYSQSGNTQGALYTSSNCVIENAYVGVLAGYDTTWLSHITPRPSSYLIGNPLNAPSDTLTFTPTAGGKRGGGAIVNITGTTFLNNQKGAVFYDYPYTPTYSEIQSTTFSTNAALLAASVSPIYGVAVYNYTVSSLSMYTNTFIDTHYDYTYTGLYTTNSYYSMTYSTFTNFLYGIYSINTSGNAATATCEHSMFTNNNTGIYLGYVNNAIIEVDTFKIRRIAHGNSIGLYLDNCHGYYVQDNYFTNYNSAAASKPYGILVNNSGAYANAIFRNSFYSLYKGSQAQYRNYVGTWQSKNGTGLLYLCNIFQPNSITVADIYVPALTGSSANITTYTGTDTAAAIGNVQGDPSPSGGNRTTAGNQFSHTSGGADFYIETSTITPVPVFGSYYTYYSSPGDCADPSSAYFPVVTSNLSLSCKSDSSTAPSCLSGPNGHTARTAYVNPITQALTDAATAKQLYDSLNALIDGGNTNDLLNLVNGNNNSSSVYNSLHAAAPYLSNAVLKTYINSNYPTSDISQILTACSPLNSEVQNTLMAANISSGIKTQITALQTGTAKVDELADNISTAFTARHFRLDDAIRILIRTKTADSIAMANALLKVKAMELPAKVQVQTGIDIHDSVMAANALTQVANAEGQSNFVKLHTLLLQNLSTSAQQLMNNASALSVVQGMATDSSDRLTYYKANALLQTVGLSNYIPYIQPTNDITNEQSQRKAAPVAAETTTIVSSQSSLYNSPNPFKESTMVKAVIVEKTQNAFIVITDMVGNEIARYPVQQGENNINVNAGGLNQAVMFCTLVVDGVKIKTNKMVLIK